MVDMYLEKCSAERCIGEHVQCGTTNAETPDGSSVGIVAGPKGGPSMAKQDILFNNDKCYVVAPGVVAKMMEKLTAVAEYDREGNLYIGEFSLSSFHRQGLNE